ERRIPRVVPRSYSGGTGSAFGRPAPPWLALRGLDGHPEGPTSCRRQLRPVSSDTGCRFRIGSFDQGGSSGCRRDHEGRAPRCQRRDVTMNAVNPYLNFDGNALQAFEFYKSVFGGELALVVRFKDMGAPPGTPASELERIAHIALPFGKDSVL